ncbi:hypothetical protein Taro_002734 [Colocasia esculenta]|uniref:Uncharacterized protein n=1 Tax=Colocasia esculenta TaxID=4460 RepID=A0A843TJY8_COLES|nr:hypothetical protein [Colocasia esculenta]
MVVRTTVSSHLWSSLGWSGTPRTARVLPGVGQPVLLTASLFVASEPPREARRGIVVWPDYGGETSQQRPGARQVEEGTPITAPSVQIPQLVIERAEAAAHILEEPEAPSADQELHEETVAQVIMDIKGKVVVDEDAPPNPPNQPFMEDTFQHVSPPLVETQPRPQGETSRSRTLVDVYDLVLKQQDIINMRDLLFQFVCNQDNNTHHVPTAKPPADQAPALSLEPPEAIVEAVTETEATTTVQPTEQHPEPPIAQPAMLAEVAVNENELPANYPQEDQTKLYKKLFQVINKFI